MIESEELGKEIPEGWKMGCLDDVIQNFISNRGKSKSTMNLQRYSNEFNYPVISAMNSLNPYSTGCWFAGIGIFSASKLFIHRLNPYSTGCWFAGYKDIANTRTLEEVLILILLDVGLLETDFN